jgi:hypothetical protein
MTGNELIAVKKRTMGAHHEMLVAGAGVIGTVYGMCRATTLSPSLSWYFALLRLLSGTR